jgi:hypothetical protein
MSNQNFPSAVRNATLVGADNKRTPAGVRIKAVLAVIAVPGVDSVQLVIEQKDPASGAYSQLLAAAARTATGTDTLDLGAGVSTVANRSSGESVPDTFRIRVIHSAASNFTYSVSITEN